MAIKILGIIMTIDEELLECIDKVYELEAYISHLYYVETWDIDMLAYRFNLPKYTIKQMLSLYPC
jgi:hypothetical protein